MNQTCNVIPIIINDKGEEKQSLLFSNILKSTKNGANRNETIATYASTKQDDFKMLAKKYKLTLDELGEYKLEEFMQIDEIKEYVENFSKVRTKINESLEQTITKLGGYENLKITRDVLKQLYQRTTWDSLNSILLSALQGKVEVPIKNGTIRLDTDKTPFLGTSLKSMEQELNKMINGGVNISKLNNIIATLQFLSHIPATLSDGEFKNKTIKRYVMGEDNKVKLNDKGEPQIIEIDLESQLRDLGRGVHALQLKVDLVNQKYAVDKVIERAGSEEKTQELFGDSINLVDKQIRFIEQESSIIGAESTGFFDIGQSKSPINQVVNSMLSDSDFAAQSQIEAKAKEVKDLYRAFEKAGYSTEEFLDEKSGTLHSKYTQTQWIDSYYKPLEEGDVETILNNGEFTIPTDLYNSHLDKYKSIFKSGDVICDAYYEDFLVRKDLAEMELISTSNKESYDYFIRTNDPSVLINNIIEFLANKRYKQEDKLEINRKRIVSFLKNNMGERPVNYDLNVETNPKWEAIQQDELKRQMFDLILSTSAEGYRKGPVVMRNNEANYIFELALQTTEQLKNSGVYKSLQTNVKDMWVQMYSKNENDKYFKFINPLSGKEEYKIFFPSQQGNLGFQSSTNPHGKSRDIINAVLTHYALATCFEQYTKIEPLLNSMSETQRRIKKKRANGDIVEDLNSAQDQQLIRTIEYRLFHKTKTDVEKPGKQVSLTSTEKEKQAQIDENIKQVNNQIEMIKEQVALNQMSLEQGNANINELNYQIAKLNESREGIVRRFSRIQLIDSINEYFRKKGLAFNLRGILSDFLLTNVTLISEGAGGQFYGLPEVLTATKIFLLRSTTGDNKVTRIIEQLNIEANVLEAKNSRANKYATKTLDRFDTNDVAYFGQSTVGKFGSSVSTIAYLLANKKGDRNLFEQFDELTLDEKRDISKKISNINYSILGNPDPTKVLTIKDKWWGRLLMTFKTYLPNAMSARFGNETPDLENAIIRRGRYIQTPQRLIKNYNEFGFIDTWNSVWSKDYVNTNKNQLDATDVANIRKNIAEILFILIGVSGVMMLKGDDDDEDLTYGQMFVINQLNRLNQDMSYFYKPNLAYQLGDNAMPALTAIKEMKDLSWNFYNLIIDEDKDEIKSGYRKGESRFWNSVESEIPYVRGIENTINAGERIIKPK